MEEKSKISGIAQTLVGLGSTRFGVVLAAILAVWSIICFAIEEAIDSPELLQVAERACYAVVILAVVHIASRSLKGKRNEEPGVKE